MLARRPTHSEAYRRHIASPKWRAIRREALARANYTCGVCNSSRNLRVHHKHYRNLGNERPEDLTVLCHDCHVLADQRRRAVAGTRRPRTKRKRHRRLPKPVRRVVLTLAGCYGGLLLASELLPHAAR